jgi:FAD/FMN-containing dehydrogenase
MSVISQELFSSLGAEKVDVSPEPRMDTSNFRNEFSAVITPTCVDDVIEAVKSAGRHKFSLYPVSTGKNWGYGSSLAPQTGSVLLDLSQLKAISDFDDELGLITIEPGVTQQQLYDFLTERNADYIVPVTGGGPNCSIIGNAIERGFGLAPYSDHFGAVVSLQAVLANGDVYSSPMADGRPSYFKWGIGPYLDGLFCQGAHGVVTRMTITLARRPERTGLFLFQVKEEKNLDQVIKAIRELVATGFGGVGGLQLMNDVRILAMSGMSDDAENSGDMLTQKRIAELAQSTGLAPWVGLGTYYGAREIAASAKTLIKRVLRPHVDRLIFVDAPRLKFVRTILGVLPKSRLTRLRESIGRVQEILDWVGGVPTEMGLLMAYWKSKRTTPKKDLDPARDRCGLYWYAPVMPMLSGKVDEFIRMVKEICGKHRFEAPINLVSMEGGYAFCSTLPLLFSADDEEQNERARACYGELFKEGVAKGFIPYRIGSQYMDLMPTACNDVYWRLNESLKQATDPDRIIAPGRYCERDPASITGASDSQEYSRGAKVNNTPV